MKRNAIYILIFFCFNWSLSHSFQSHKDHASITLYYETVEGNLANSEALKAIASKLLWELKPMAVDTDDRYTISLESIRENKWVQVELHKLRLIQKSKDSIIVTGVLFGRQPLECEYIHTPFKHVWILNDTISNQITQN